MMTPEQKFARWVRVSIIFFADIPQTAGDLI
jgi:hypothetical protein